MHGPPNAKRRPGQEAASATTTSDQHSPYIPDPMQAQRAARHLSRRFAIGLAVATVIVAELGLGAPQ
jgi:hypothetical protein